MSKIKVLLGFFGLVLVLIQFIRVPENRATRDRSSDIASVVFVPDTIMLILQKACYDCHSNYTRYPWYFKVQPVGWFLANHIKHAKANLNFSEFGDYSLRKQISKLNGISNSIQDKTMPLFSYRLMHKNARLDKYERDNIVKWAEKSHDSLALKK